MGMMPRRADPVPRAARTDSVESVPLAIPFPRASFRCMFFVKEVQMVEICPACAGVMVSITDSARAGSITTTRYRCDGCGHEWREKRIL